ncbi:hypothetical protein [Konateibacter massiliensis]|uniref:hypothetical protein n=1 Tax=Konateibacter massiliensis TaxID=2002841 RepID=UPI000C14EF91|nr:hypothetical protein [Konateibacter massiliensis]
MERVESLKAKERILNPTQNFVEGQKGETIDIVANKLGIGSGEQYRKEKFIVDNQSSLSPQDFADWDEGKRCSQLWRKHNKQKVRNYL